MSRRLNLSVRDIELLEHLAASRRLAGMFPGKSAFLLLRETYFDTPDGLLRERGMKLCLRVEARGRQVVELTVQDVVNLQGVVEETVLEIPVVGGGLYSTVSGQSEVATRLRGVADMAALRPQLALDIDREERDLKSSWWGRPQHRVSFDHVVAHSTRRNARVLCDHAHGARGRSYESGGGGREAPYGPQSRERRT